MSANFLRDQKRYVGAFVRVDVVGGGAGAEVMAVVAEKAVMMKLRSEL